MPPCIRPTRRHLSHRLFPIPIPPAGTAAPPKAKLRSVPLPTPPPGPLCVRLRSATGGSGPSLQRGMAATPQPHMHMLKHPTLFVLTFRRNGDKSKKQVAGVQFAARGGGGGGF